MSPQKVAWLFMQGFQTKYYLSEAACGDFVVNHQAMTLHTRKAWQVPLRHNFHQPDRKLVCEMPGETWEMIACKGCDGNVKRVCSQKRKTRETFQRVKWEKEGWSGSEL